MDNPRRIVGVQWLEAGASAGNSVLILRVHYSNRRWNRDVVTVYHYPEVGMYVIVGDFAEAGKGEVIARLLVLIEGDAPHYDGNKDSQQDDEPWYPPPPILLWPAHPLVSPPPRARIRLFDELIGSVNLGSPACRGMRRPWGGPSQDVGEGRTAEPILHVLSVAPLLPAGEGVIEALGPILHLLDEPLDEVLLLDRIVGMGQPEPPAGLVVPLGLVREDRLPPVPGSDVLEE